jgi:hypothetical protein
MQAYRQAAANSAAATANGGKAAATTGMSGSNLLTKQTGLDLDEACKILNIKKDSLILEEINKVSFALSPGLSLLGRGDCGC